VDIDEIYDGFNYGIAHPQAVKDFLSYAYNNWQPPAPQYVVLVGDATKDPKGNLFAVNPGVPTYLGWTRYMGETPMDDWFTQIVGGDALGDLYLGRLPASDQKDAAVMVQKIIGYEEAPTDQPWQKRLLLIADNNEPIFEQINEAIAGLIPTEYTLIKGYLDDTTSSALSTQIEAEIENEDAGVLIVNYAGHGSVTQWAEESIFTTERVPDLSNDRRLPVMLLMTCWNGYFVEPKSTQFEGTTPERSLAEEMLLAHTEDQFGEIEYLTGAVATFASIGMTNAQVQKLLDQGFIEAVFQGGITRLGEAAAFAKETLLANSTNEVDTAKSFGLLGDPAMTLPVQTASATPAAGGGGGGGGGCFIASAAYGSFLDKHVHILRSFRDRWLIEGAVGNYLVKTYYTLSPPVAGWIKSHGNIQALTRIVLAPLVATAKIALDRAFTICLVLLLLVSPLLWTHCLIKGRKRAFSKQ
jgi:hypothetical protein